VTVRGVGHQEPPVVVEAGGAAAVAPEELELADEPELPELPDEAEDPPPT
jgi:hypothetical protein